MTNSPDKKLSLAELKQLNAIAEALEKKQKESLILRWKPYLKQWQFLNNRSQIKALCGGNQCLGSETLIEDARTGEKRPVSSIKGRHWVWSWDGSKRVKKLANQPFLKGIEPIYKITLENGEWFTASPNHLYLSQSGWEPLSSVIDASLDVQRECGPTLLPTTLGTFPSAHVSNVRRCYETALNFLAGYRHSHCFCDEQPQKISAGVQGASPLQAGAREHSHSPCPSPSAATLPCTPSDDPARPKLGDTHACHTVRLLSSLDGRVLIGVPCAATEFYSERTLWIPVSDLLPTVPQSTGGFGLPVQPIDEADPQAKYSLLRFSVAFSPCLVTSKTKIVQIEYLRNDYVWDFEVPDTHNYFCAGVLHHNSGKTSTGAFEVACHLTGLYPKEWDGHRFNFAPSFYVAGEDSVLVRDTLQKKLFGEIGELGTGLIPKDAIIGEPTKKTGVPGAIDFAKIRHTSGDISTVSFKSYDQGREKFQSTTIDGVWFDEEPPDDVFKEAKMRTIAKNGRVILTFTPLKGVTPLIDDLMSKRPDDVYFLTWDDVDHLSAEAKAFQLEGLAPHEIESRVYGRPTVGTGRVYQFAEEEYTCPRFAIPHYWPRIGGLDVGISHPTCAVELAIDPDSGVGYVVQEYKKAGETPVYHANFLYDWGIRFAIDPNSRQRSIATADSPLAMFQRYLGEERLILADNRVNYGISVVRAKIASGQFYIFNDLHEILKEMRLYRFKDNGDIFKVDDDLVDAMRYAAMAWDEAMPKNKFMKAPVVVNKWQPVDRRLGY